MDKMLKDCEKDILAIEEILLKLKSQPPTRELNYRIAAWEDMLFDVRERAVLIKEFMKARNK